MTTYDDPIDLARRATTLARPTLVAYDCDGVLAPIVDHADDSVLLPGITDQLTRLHELGVAVAIVSGRSLSGLEQFSFPPEIIVIGSHGAERRGRSTTPLDQEESARLRRLDQLARSARDTAGAGAWIEEKPASVVLHVRQAGDERARRALDELTAAASEVEGAHQKPGSGVLELIARTADKGSAIARLCDETSSASCAFLGDDRTDEDAFATLGDGDLTIKVGPGETTATSRLGTPADVLQWTRALADGLEAERQNNVR